MPVSNFLISGETERSIQGLVLNAGPVAKGILLVLLFLSILSWAVMIQKAWRFNRLASASRRFWRSYSGKTFIQSFHECASAAHRSTPLQKLLLTGIEKGYGISNPTVDDWARIEEKGRMPGADADRLERAIDRIGLLEMERLERRLPILATTANVSPFLGLFGTVWGVMGSFLAMGSRGSANLAVVGPGIAEALITTLAGLAAAIPAVIAYNHFLGQLRLVSTDLERFRSSLTDRLTKGPAHDAP